VQQRAQATLKKAVSMLEEIQQTGLFQALEQAMFADISRKPTAGRGLDGVFAKSPQYLNPFLTLLTREGTRGQV